MKTKKVLSLTLAAVMAASLTACGGGSTEADTTAASQTEAATTAAEEKATEGEESKETEAAAGGSITVAAVETAYGKPMWESVAKAFTEETGIEVNLIVDKKLEDIITPDMKAGNYPDVIMRAVGSEQALTETFVKDNNVVELTDVLDRSWRRSKGWR